MGYFLFSDVESLPPGGNPCSPQLVSLLLNTPRLSINKIGKSNQPFFVVMTAKLPNKSGDQDVVAHAGRKLNLV